MATALTGCAPDPPAALAGLWSRSLAACAAGLGVTFRGDAVRGRFGGETFVLLADPRYEVRDAPEGMRVRISYRLPEAPGGVRGDLGRGIIELHRSAAGRLTPASAWFADLQTGAVHASLGPGPLDTALSLGLCPRSGGASET